MSRARRGLCGPTGEPIGSNGGPRMSTEQPVEQAQQLIAANQQLIGMLNAATKELHHWRQLDATRFFAGNIISGAVVAYDLLLKTDAYQQEKVDQSYSLAEMMVKAEFKRRPKPPAEAEQGEPQPSSN
jgi:hypothetical protein